MATGHQVFLFLLNIITLCFNYYDHIILFIFFSLKGTCVSVCERERERVCVSNSSFVPTIAGLGNCIVIAETRMFEEYFFTMQ